MSHRLPPLSALRSFEAAARHLSFTRAADELGVTPGAVSQQVKSLETALGIKVFRRLPRSLVLTDAGETYLAAINAGPHPGFNVERIDVPGAAGAATQVALMTLPGLAGCHQHRRLLQRLKNAV